MTATVPAPPTHHQPATHHAHPAKAANTTVMLACLQALILANLVQVAAAFAGIEPSPPLDVVPGIAATAVLGLAALPLVRGSVRLGYGLGIGFCLASMIGMGPHKLFLPDGGVIAPLALVGFAFEVLFIVHASRALRPGRGVRATR